MEEHSGVTERSETGSIYEALVSTSPISPVEVMRKKSLRERTTGGKQQVATDYWV